MADQHVATGRKGKKNTRIFPGSLWIVTSTYFPSRIQDFQFGQGGGGGPSSSAGGGGGGGGAGGAGGSGGGGGGKVPPLIREFLSSLDDKEWQSELYNLLQKQSFNQVEVDLFELLCKVLDHNLFAQVDWARNSYYFKELKVGYESILHARK